MAKLVGTKNKVSKESTPADGKNSVDYMKLTDTPSRLFRRIAIDELKLNLATWKTYLDDYIRKLHPDKLDDMERVKRDRSTTIGNVNDTLWQRSSLTFKKLLTGLYILKANRVKITIEVEFKSGKVVTVDEEIHMDSKQDNDF